MVSFIPVSPPSPTLQVARKGGVAAAEAAMAILAAAGSGFIQPGELAYTGAGLTTEANARRTALIARTMSACSVKVQANTLNGNCVLTVRKNNADTGLTVTVAGAATGIFAFSGTAPSYAAGDTYSVKADATAAAAGQIDFTSCEVQWS